MAKMDWDRVTVENLDYRHKNEIERKEEEKALFPVRGSSTLHPCPYCGLEVSASKYRFHFAEVHFFMEDSISITMLVARFRSNRLLFSAIPTCVFDDVWKLLRANFDFDQHYSSGEIVNKLPREALRFTLATQVIELSGRKVSDIKEIAKIIKVVTEKYSWWRRVLVGLGVAGFDKSFWPALVEELRGKAGKAKGNSKRKRSKKKRKSSQLRPQ